LNELNEQGENYMKKYFPNQNYAKMNLQTYKAFMKNKLKDLIMKRHVYFINEDLDPEN